MSKQFNGEKNILKNRLTGTEYDGEISIIGIEAGDKDTTVAVAIFNCLHKLHALEDMIESGDLVPAQKQTPKKRVLKRKVEKDGVLK